VAEKQRGRDQAPQAESPEQDGIHPAAVVHQEMAHQDHARPGDAGQDPSLGRVSLAVGEEGVVQEVGQGDDEQGGQVPLRPPEGLHHPGKDEEKPGAVEEKAVPLVEEIVEERIDPQGKRDPQDHLPEGPDLLRCQHALVDGHGQDGPVELADVQAEKDQGSGGPGQESEHPARSRSLPAEEPGAHRGQGEEDEDVLKPEPGEKPEQQAQQHAGRRGKLPGQAELPEDEKREKSHGRFRVEVHGVEKHRGGEGIQEPEEKRRPLPPPVLQGEQVDLEPEQHRPQGEAHLQDVDQHPPVEEPAQRVIGKDEHRDPGLVDGVHVAGALAAEPGVGPQPELRVKLPGKEVKIVLVIVVSGQVDVPVLVEAVGGEEVVGFVSGIGQSRGNETQRGQVVGDEGHEEKDEEPSLKRKGAEAVHRGLEALLERPPAVPLGEFHQEETGGHGPAQEVEPEHEIARGQVTAEEEGREKREGERQVGHEVFPEQETEVPAEKPLLEPPDAVPGDDENEEKEEKGERRESRGKTENVASGGERGRLAEERGQDGRPGGDDREKDEGGAGSPLPAHPTLSCISPRASPTRCGRRP